MSHFEITLAEYSKALVESADSAYRQHLITDYRVMPNGKVIARWTVDKSPDSVYLIRDRFKLFSSL